VKSGLTGPNPSAWPASGVAKPNSDTSPSGQGRQPAGSRSSGRRRGDSDRCGVFRPQRKACAGDHNDQRRSIGRCRDGKFGRQDRRDRSPCRRRSSSKRPSPRPPVPHHSSGRSKPRQPASPPSAVTRPRRRGDSRSSPRCARPISGVGHRRDAAGFQTRNRRKDQPAKSAVDSLSQPLPAMAAAQRQQQQGARLPQPRRRLRRRPAHNTSTAGGSTPAQPPIPA